MTFFYCLLIFIFFYFFTFFRHGETPLHFASRGNSLESTTLLLQAGADPTVDTSDGQSTYSITRKPEIKKVLLDWYVANNKPLPAEIKEDNSEASEGDESSDKKTRRKKPRKERNGSVGKSPKTGNNIKKKRMADGFLNLLF